MRGKKYTGPAKASPHRESDTIPDEKAPRNEENTGTSESTARHEGEDQSFEGDKRRGGKAGGKKKQRGPVGALKDTIDRLKKNKILFVARQTKFRKKIVKWLMRLFKNCLKIIRIYKMHVTVRASLADPALEGRLYALCTGLRYALTAPGPDTVRIIYNPAFDSAAAEARCDIACRSSLAALSRPVFMALCTFPWLSAFIVWRKTRAFVRAGRSAQADD
ncbi:MAG: hypothetical protein GF350_10950 [Chitinivibrionales bacterium]|nr:hypothetical protein [Chitinivibrionales bacterium]